HVHPPPLHSFPTRRSSDLPFRRDERGSVAERVMFNPMTIQIAATAAGSRDLEAKQPARVRRHESFVEVDQATVVRRRALRRKTIDRKSTRLNSSHVSISYA